MAIKDGEKVRSKAKGIAGKRSEDRSAKVAKEVGMKSASSVGRISRTSAAVTSGGAPAEAKAIISVSKMKKTCEDVCQILKSLSHPQRLMILGYLLNQPRTVSQLVELTGISQSQVSQFLTRLKYEGLIQSERQGKFQFYSIADQRLIHLMTAIQANYCRI